MEVTSTLAEFIVETRFDDLPEVAIERAKKSILDLLGVTIAGAAQPIGKIIAQYLEENGAATVIGLSRKAIASKAAFANGTLGHALDYDDTSYTLLGHPTVTIFPAVLALSEVNELSGRSALEAFVTGFEVACRIGAGIATTHYRRGWHATGTLGTLGATAATAKLLNLDKDSTIRALGIGASEAAGIRENFGTMTKAFHAGRAAENGVVATQLAKGGFTSSRTALEGKWGFFNIMADKVDYESITKGLGKSWDLVNSGVALKQYPCCAGTHPAIDGITDLARRHNIDPEDVEKIECGTNPIGLDELIHSKPRTPTEAKFSMEFCAAIAMVDRAAFLDQFTAEKLSDQRVQRLMEKVRLYEDEEIAKEGYASRSATRIKIRLKDGKEYSALVRIAKGNPENPMTDEELRNKFTNCAKSLLPKERIEKVIEIVQSFEDERVNSLTSLF